MGQTEVTVFKVLDVSHHLRFRTVAVENRVMQVVYLTGERSKKGRVKPDSLHGANAQRRAKRGKVLVVGALVQ